MEELLCCDSLGCKEEEEGQKQNKQKTQWSVALIVNVMRRWKMAGCEALL